MTANIVRFPSQETLAIPMPIFAQNGEQHEAVLIEDDAYLSVGLARGAVLIVSVGTLHEHLYQAIKRNGGYVFCTIQFVTPVRVRVTTLDSGVAAQEIDVKDLNILGSVTEMWPLGLGAGLPRWVYWQGEPEVAQIYSRPLLRVTS